MLCFPDVDLVDLIKQAKLWEEPPGVGKVPGRCVNENYGRELDTPEFGYRLSEGFNVSIATSELFEEFSEDYSFLFVVRSQPG